ncbi:MAG: hypothetical protein KAI66_11120 [Lentisphaeria bacterium]|nr:hypothetical protein [Lentisphaeria bacterium]
MTLRAIIVGLVGAVGIGAFGYFHDCVMNPHDSARLVPHLMPPVVYGALILLPLIANNALKRLRPRWTLRAGELAVVTALALVACAVPFYGMVHCWPSAMMLPHHYNRVRPAWSRENVLELVPEKMLADATADGGHALTGYVTGMGGAHHISPRAIPWGAWLPSLAFWIPLVLAISVATLGWALVLHRQWSRHEHLPYPISRFAHTLMPKKGEAVSALFRKRAFWWAAGAVFAIHLINYCAVWWPEFMIPVRLHLDFGALAPFMRPMVLGDGRRFFHPRIIFTVIGLAYFFRSDVSFSLAVVPFAVCYFMGILTGYGVSVAPGFSLFHNTKIFLYLGGYVGIVLMLLYTGRRHYLGVLRRSLFLSAQDQIGSDQVWGMRVFLVGSALFAYLLVTAGLDWPLSVIYTGLSIVIFTAVSRAIAETGGFYVGTWLMPGALLWGLMGAQALGPATFATICMVSIIVLVGPGWAPMPFAIQGLQLADLTGVHTGRLTMLMVGALVLALAVALPATIYWQYDRGIMQASNGWARYPPALPFDQALKMKHELKAQGTLETASELHGLQRFAHLKPNGTFLTAFLLMLAITIGVSICRLRFPWWPLHPIAFFFLGSHQAQRLAFSFFLGWLVKSCIQRFGGERAYRQLIPIAVGLVTGEVLASMLTIVVGILYYFITGKPPMAYSAAM